MSGYTVKYFMWSFQTHYQMSANILAKDVFGLLHQSLSPEVFLVGVLSADRKDRLPLCVEPDDCKYQPELFKGVHSRAKALLNTPSDVITLHPTEWHARDAEHRRFIGCVTTAIQEVVDEESDSTAVISFCSFAREVEGFLVSVVLQLNRVAYDQWYQLKKSATSWGSVSRSLLEATVHEYLEHSAREVSLPEAGRWSGRSKEYRDIVRAAGNHLMYTPAVAGGNPYGLHGLFDACNTISSLKYEGREGLGNLVLARPDHPSVIKDLTLSRPVALTDHRAARKIMELSSDSVSLLCDSRNLYALGRVASDYDSACEDVFVVRFIKHHMWELRHNDVPLMRVIYGEPRLPHPHFDANNFKRNAYRILPGLDDERLDRLTELCWAASRARHGAMLVISPRAREEAQRLAAQSIPVEPLYLGPDVLELATGIDGAILVDTDGICHAIGVILDGVACKKGTPSRGARYNSAVHYVYGRGDCLAVVISEDGMIDVLPDLLPQIRRTEISHALEQLHKLAGAKVADRKEFYSVMHWFDDHRFYLSQAVCVELACLYPEAEKRLKNQDMLIVFNDFTPNEDMNESYFLDE